MIVVMFIISAVILCCVFWLFSVFRNIAATGVHISDVEVTQICFFSMCIFVGL
jgi:hypothetical protein